MSTGRAAGGVRWSRGIVAVLAALAVIAAACSGDEASDEPADPTGTEPAAPVPTAEPEATETEPVPDQPAGVVLPDYAAQAVDFDDAPDDRSLPPLDPDNPTGSYGFSRYVYNQVGDDIVATLVEGPRGRQVRCQDFEQDCSYLELKALYESGEPVPEYLDMTKAELGELVAQLDAVNAAVDEHRTLEEACAAGFTVSSAQNANMGIHVLNPNGSTVAFDPGRPTMVLYAKDGGEKLTREEQGSCSGGEWTGEPGYESVGAVFTLLMTEDHPDAFAGPIDNWHIHFNTCAGSRTEGGATDEADLEAEADGTRGSFSREACEANGGQFTDVIPVWMMHAYVDPAHDAQGGVFAMFNPAIWPLAESPDEIERLRTANLSGAVNASINNFAFGDISADVGEAIRFSNSDSVPHTVTAGSPSTPLADFDSGLLGTGQTYELSFDEPGQYALFCALHPGMTGTVTVE